MDKNLLIVEDEADFVPLLELQAKKRGYQCIIDNSGIETVQKALVGSPVAILLDMNLPKISGLGLIQEIKKHKELENIPIIAFSALDSREIKQEAMSRGANAYFVKGYPIDDLFDVVDGCVAVYTENE